jgi:hypothetical protein
MIFIAILILSTLAIAGCAAFFSVYGLATIFEGAFIPVILMGSALEAGKLIATSFLYRYWNTTTWLLKTYLTTAVIILMLITSVGIYGFLSNAHQKETLPLQQIEQQVSSLNAEKQSGQDRLKQIDDQIANLPDDYVSGRNKLSAQFKTERARIDKRQTEITAQLYEMNSKLIQQRVHTGPIVFIAKALGKEVDNATSYMILLIIFAFDPLAVALTLGVNVALTEYKNSKQINTSVLKSVELADIPTTLQPSVGDSVTTLNDVIAEVHEGITTDRLKQLLDEMSHQQLSPQEVAQKTVLEEMFNKRKVLDRVRNPNS